MGTYMSTYARLILAQAVPTSLSVTVCLMHVNQKMHDRFTSTLSSTNMLCTLKPRIDEHLQFGEAIPGKKASYLTQLAVSS